MSELKVTSVKHSTAEVFRFRFERQCGWANFTLCEDTGEFSIQSDWGSYAYAWPGAAQRGNVSLKQFLIGCNSQYICMKFGYQKSDDFKNEFNPDKTLEGFKWTVLKERRNGDITKDAAKTLWISIDDTEPCASPDLFLERMDDWLKDYLSEPWEYLIYEMSPTKAFVQNELLPFFLNYLRDQEAVRESV